MSRRSLFWLFAIVSALLPLAGCNSPSAKPAKYRIAVIPKGTSHSFWKSIHAGAVQAGRERGDTEILWEGPANEDQRAEQQQIVERFTSEGVSALILAPVDRQTLVVPVEGAIHKSIPVVIIDSGLDVSDAIQNSDNYLGYVATDNHQGGVEAAKRMIELLKGKDNAKVLMVRYQAGSQSTELREKGFSETIKTAPNITFIEAADEAGATVDSAQKVGERLLSDYKDLDGVFAPNESSVDGMLRAIDVLGKAGQIKVVGFDFSDILISALRANKVQGLVLQDPFDMGYQSVKLALDHLQGMPPPKEKTLHTNLKVATPENMDDPAINLLYARDLKQYLGE